MITEVLLAYICVLPQLTEYRAAGSVTDLLTSAAIYRQTDARCLTDSLSQHMTHLEKEGSSLRHQEASMRVGAIS